MKYIVEFTASDPMFHEMIECKRIIEADSLPQALHETIESAKIQNLKILGITNYYWLED